MNGLKLSSLPTQILQTSDLKSNNCEVLSNLKTNTEFVADMLAFIRTVISMILWFCKLKIVHDL